MTFPVAENAFSLQLLFELQLESRHGLPFFHGKVSSFVVLVSSKISYKNKHRKKL
jgi:hypothetical protein